ncbi:aryl-sulfate sulfotransferase [Halorarius litoreus]|uniref:aryl-sulfate sulfotransferase n=1 Tax=Halorarius litoreus TaxID=2962676 RepID=UPI0020CC936B|nr:aryl-sulfate sulfotransferase [Halorarius litoreus]
MRRLSFLVALLLVVPTGAAVAVSAQSADTSCAGTMVEPAGGTTVISVQGARGRNKTPARLVGVGPRGELKWVHGGPEDVIWGYDVDPLDNGNLFVVGTFREGGHGKTLMYEFNPRTQETVWVERVNITDTHDADLLDDGRIAIANMRNYDEANGTNSDRLVIYNRTTDSFEEEWLFRDHYDPETGGPYEEDWTHVNDIDRVNGSHYLLSPRNLDQVILVDIETGDIELKLGSDNDFRTLKRQHNPQYLESEDGTPTLLVADSDNDRIVEFQKQGDQWQRTWTLGSDASLAWPRDADRLANGNTLVVDSRNNRVLEVTPTGEVVWEVYSPWLVYDAERVRVGDDDVRRGPTIADLGASGTYSIQGAPVFSTADQEACAAAIDAVGPNEIREVSTVSATATATTPTPPTPGDGAGFGLLVALVALLGVGLLTRD